VLLVETMREEKKSSMKGERVEVDERYVRSKECGRDGRGDE